MKDHVSELETMLFNAGRLCKSAGFADLGRAAVAGFREIDFRLSKIEKQVADDQAARFGFGAADSDRARNRGDVSGVAKTLGRGTATSPAEANEKPPAGFPGRFGGH